MTTKMAPFLSSSCLIVRAEDAAIWREPGTGAIAPVTD